MASRTLQVANVFPSGTTVGAYKRSLWSSAIIPSGAPSGSPDTTAVVGTDGSLAFSGLTDDTEYVAGAQVSGTWTYERFRTPAASFSTGQPPIRVLLAGHSHAADTGATFPDYGGYHKLASHLQPSRLNSLARGGAMVCAPENATVASVFRAGGYARFLNEVLGNGKSPPSAPYVAGQQFTVLNWGANDMAWMGPTTFGVAYPHALRSVISRARAASVFEETDASVAYTGTWSGAGLPNGASGAAYKQTSTQGDSLTITIPADFEGGTLALGFITAADGRGALWTITGTGCAAGVNTTHDSRNINAFNNGSTRAATGQIMGSCKRITGLAAGAGTLTLTVTTINGIAFFDYWQIESNDPGPVALVKEWYFANYSLYSGYPYTPGDADMDTVNAAIDSLIAEFADPRVYAIATNDVFNKSASLFIGDGAHLNDKGHGLLAERLLSSFQAKQYATLTMTKPVTTDRRWWNPVSANDPVAFANSWVNSGVAGKPVTGYYKDWTNGLVAVKGSVKSGTAATAAVLTLPAGYRPRDDVTFAIDGNGVAGIGKLTPAGVLSFVVGGDTLTGTHFSFTFFAEQ